jgi:hypothetical protein
LIVKVGSAQNDSTQIKPDTIIQITIDTSNVQKFSYDTLVDGLNIGVQPDTTAVKMPELSILKEEEIETVDSTTYYYFYSSVQNLKTNTTFNIDTSLTNAHVFNPLNTDYSLFSTLSNIGLAHNNMVFETKISTGYNMNLNSFNKYVISNEKVKYYKLYIPQSKISYVMGSKKEQNLNVTLNREVIKNLIIGFNYTLNSSPGPYKRSNTNNSRVFFTGQYYTPNMRYGVLANYRNSRIRVEESGGIINDSIFENNIETDRRVIDVNLNKASQRLIVSGFHIEQYFNILKPKSKIDSSTRKIDAGHISHSINYERNQLIYEDAKPISEFYHPFAPALDSTSTFDSTYQSKLTNKLMWSSLGYNEDEISKVFYLYFGAKHDLISQTLAYDSVATNYYQIRPFAGISLTLFKSMQLKASGELIFSDYSGGDYKIQADVIQHLGTIDKNIGRIDGGILLVNRKPSWWYENFNSNRFRWNNNFDKETSMLIHGKYSLKDINAGFKFNTFTNYTYLDDSVKPKQLNGAETHLQLFIEGSIPFKKVGLSTRLVYQKTSQPGIIRVPEFSGLMNIYFRSNIFKDAATVQTGLQFTYFSSYYADAYMPELRAFYLQNEKKIGDYVFADFYLTLNVKRAVMFFKIAHLNGYLGNYHYYSAPHYPSRDARFYFGISWRFLY